MGKTLAEDPAVAALIAPYHDKVTSQMQEVLGTAPTAIVKGAGENPLSNFVADLQRVRASQVLGQPIPLGVMTNGGLRAGFAAAGPTGARAANRPIDTAGPACTPPFHTVALKLWLVAN